MPSVIEIGPSVLEKKVIKLLQCIFVISLFSPLGKGRDTLFEKNFNSLHPRILCAKFG